MATTNFVDETGSIDADWLNDIDATVYQALAAATTPAEVITALGITASAAELSILAGVTASAAELNILDGVTSNATELNILDGVTSNAAELNILDGVTSTAAELNILDGVTSTAAELNIIDGSTAATATTIVDADRIPLNDNGTMVQVAVTDLVTYMNGGLKTKVIDIGDWDMDTTTFLGVAHGLTLANIRSVTAMIRDDTDTNHYPTFYNPTSGGTVDCAIYCNAANAVLTRTTSGHFDSTSFDSTTYNRGWITIQYV